jgi:hypothetical protein
MSKFEQINPNQPDTNGKNKAKEGGGITRRKFLQRLGAGALVTGMGPVGKVFAENLPERSDFMREAGILIDGNYIFLENNNLALNAGYQKDYITSEVVSPDLMAIEIYYKNTDKREAVTAKYTVSKEGKVVKREITKGFELEDYVKESFFIPPDQAGEIKIALLSIKHQIESESGYLSKLIFQSVNQMQDNSNKIIDLYKKYKELFSQRNVDGFFNEIFYSLGAEFKNQIGEIPGELKKYLLRF